MKKLFRHIFKVKCPDDFVLVRRSDMQDMADSLKEAKRAPVLMDTQIKVQAKMIGYLNKRQPRAQGGQFVSNGGFALPTGETL